MALKPSKDKRNFLRKYLGPDEILEQDLKMKRHVLAENSDLSPDP